MKGKTNTIRIDITYDMSKIDSVTLTRLIRRTHGVEAVQEKDIQLPVNQPEE